MVNDTECGFLSSFIPVTSWEGSALTLHWDVLKMLQGFRGLCCSCVRKRSLTFACQALCMERAEFVQHIMRFRTSFVPLPCFLGLCFLGITLSCFLMNGKFTLSFFWQQTLRHNQVQNNVHCAFFRM